MTISEKQTVIKVLNLMLFYRHQPYYTELGLCHWICVMHDNDIISDRELFLISTYIVNNRPSIWSVDRWIYHPIISSNYYWKQGCVTPRVRWIKKHISKLIKSTVNERHN